MSNPKSMNAGPIDRIQENLLARAERRLLNRLCACMPRWMVPDILTAIGMFGAFVIFSGYILSNLGDGWLWISIAGYFIHWFGDSMDGSLARYRKIERPRYGYFLDHSCDGLATTLVVVGIGLSRYVQLEVALVALANGILGGIGGMFGYPDVSFQQLLGFVFAPVMYLIGIPWEQAGAAGGLFGTKIVLNEFVAYINLGQVQGALSPTTIAIVTFALCGFANFSSIAIQMAVTGNLAPNQRPMIAKLGVKALIAGSLANLMSAALAGLMLSL